MCRYYTVIADVPDVTEFVGGLEWYNHKMGKPGAVLSDFPRKGSGCSPRYPFPSFSWETVLSPSRPSLTPPSLPSPSRAWGLSCLNRVSTTLPPPSRPCTRAYTARGKAGTTCAAGKCTRHPGPLRFSLEGAGHWGGVANARPCFAIGGGGATWGPTGPRPGARRRSAGLGLGRRW